MPSARLRIVSLSRLRTIYFLVFFSSLLVPGCASRYRIELFLTQNSQRTEVKVEKSEYLIGTVLGDPSSQDKVSPGDGNCLVIITGSRGRTLDAKAEDLVSFDRYNRFRIFLQLPSVITPDTLPLEGNSFVQQLGRYEVEVENKMYFPIEGTAVVDSLSGNRLFGGIDGRFQNKLQESVVFQGQFKVKVAN
jgi:hypothetical protein